MTGMTTTTAQRDKAVAAKTSVVAANIATIKNAVSTFKASPTAANSAIMATTVLQADRDLADSLAAIDRLYGHWPRPIAPGVNPDSAAGAAAVSGLVA